MRLILAWILAGPAALAQPVLTAVYTLADHHTVRWSEERDPVSKVAGVCRMVPGTPLFSLACTAPPVGAPRKGGRYYYGVVLLRDLEENLYLAACAAASRETRCNDLKAGQTFSAEVEEQTIRLVVDAEQLPLRIFEFRPRPTTIDSPTRGTPSQVRPSSGAPSQAPWSRTTESQGTPSQTQPSVVSAAGGTPSRLSISEPSIAVAATTAGRLWLYCATPLARVFLDGKMVGTAPLDIPVLPGRHTLRVQAAGHREWNRTVVVPAGGQVKVTAELSR